MSNNESTPPDDPKLRQVARNLRDLQAEAGVPLSDEDALSAADIYVGKGDSRPVPQTLISDLAAMLRRRGGLYRRGRELVTINEGTGEMEVMDTHAFVSWVPMVAGIVTHCGKKIDKSTGREMFELSSLSVEQARLILASHEMKAKMPEIRCVNLVPMPVYREKLDERGCKVIEWLEPGYDAQTKSFTVHGGPQIDFSLDGLEAAEWMFKIVKTFEWSDKMPDGRSNRMAVHFALMVTCLARYLFAGKSPAFLYGSNLEGSGKGALMKMAMMPVFRIMGSTTIDPSDKVELLKTLNTKAVSGDPYILADEMPEGCEIRNQHLARLLTENIWEFRGMGQDKSITKVDITKLITVFAGNRVTVNRNLNRRVMHVDLFPHQEARDRVLPADAVMLDDVFFENDKNLDKLLSCVAAMIRYWDEMGRPVSKDRDIPSFANWSKIVGGIVESVGLGKPLAPFEAPGSGDDDSRTMRKLTTLVIDQFCFVERDGARVPLESVTVTMKDIVRTARLHDLFTERLGSIEQVLDDLNGRKGHKWKEVPDSGIDAELIGDEVKPSAVMREPNKAEKRLQAAEFLDTRGDSSGSAWGKFFKRMAVDEQWRTSSCGVSYKFGERGASKSSRFVLRKTV